MCENVRVRLYILTKSLGKGNGSFYIVQYPVRWTAQSALHFFALPGRPVHSDTNSASPGSILVMQQLAQRLNQSHFHHRL